MTGPERIRAAIMAVLESVPGIGVTHNYERFSKQNDSFQALFSVAESEAPEARRIVRGWCVHRQSWREYPYDTGKNRIRTRWVVTGYASLLDTEKSELSFDAVLDRATAAFRARPVLHDDTGMALCHTRTDEGGAGLQVEDSGPVMFAGLLCHRALCSLVTEHLEEIEPGISDPCICKDETTPPGIPRPLFVAAIDPVDTIAPAAELTVSIKQTNGKGGNHA